MVPVDAARLSAALLGGEIDATTWDAGREGLPPPVRVALAAWRDHPRDPDRAHDLAAVLIAALPGLPELTRLAQELTRASETAGHSNSISGATVSGSSIQARNISGGVHIHQADAARALPLPRQLLPVPPRFVDRAEDTAVLDIIRGAGLVVVTGPAGGGKTAFVSHWLHRIRADYPDGQLYADLRGHAPGTPAVAREILGQFLRAYGFADVPADPDEQAALWRSVVTDRRIAVMLDDAVSAAQVRPLLPGTSDSLVVVVSRRRLSGLLADGAAYHELGLLEPRVAAELLTSRIGEQRALRERQAVDEVVALCGLPLALCLAGARIAARPRQTVASLAQALSCESGRLAALRAEGNRAVQAALDESCAGLSPGSLRCYRRLGVLPFTVFGPGTVAAACGVSATAAETAVDELIEVSLLEELGDDQYRLHDLVRLHAAARAEAEDTPQDIDDAVRRAVGWFLSAATTAERLLTPSHRVLPRDYPPGVPAPPDFPDPATALNWLSREQTQLMTALRTAAARDWPATVWQLAHALWPLWHRLRPHDLWVEALESGLAAARITGPPEAVSEMLTGGGGALLNAGRPDDALERYAEAFDDALRTGDRAAEGQALHGMGRCHQDAGRTARAGAYFVRALARREAAGLRRGAALTRYCLGDIALADGRPGEAVGQLAVAHRELTAVRDRHDAARAQALLGRAHAACGDLPTARAHLTAALAEFRATGSVHWQGRTAELLGLTALDDGDPATARDWFERSLDTYLSVSPKDTRRLRDRISSLDLPPPGS